MNGLNDAFERLREVVPNVNTEQVCHCFPNVHQITFSPLAENEQDRDPVGGTDLHQGVGEADGLCGRGGGGGGRLQDRSPSLA